LELAACRAAAVRTSTNIKEGGVWCGAGGCGWRSGAVCTRARLPSD
jgi:hypothetical protein